MTGPDRRVILFEANEIPFRVLDRFVDLHPGSHLARLLPRCAQYTTRAPDSGHLSPWVTWPTVHRGVDNRVHGISQLGQDVERVDRSHPPVWRLLAREGIPAGVFGSLHSWPVPGDGTDYAFYLPDSFASDARCRPASVEPFQRFNLAMTRGSPRNASRHVDPVSAAGFLAALPHLGIGPRTVAEVVRQLVAEQRTPDRRGRRRTLQAVLSFDIFLDRLRRTRPVFATFFTNHVASAMHRFWAAIFPEDYASLDLDEAWRARFAGEIDYAMGWADRFLGKLAKFADDHPEHLVVMASSMGQAASRGERVDTQLYLRRPERLLRRAGLAESDWERLPSMEPRVNLRIRAGAMDRLQGFLARLAVDGEPLESEFRDPGFAMLRFGHADLDEDAVTLDGAPVPTRELGLERVSIRDGARSTGYHVPEGILVVYDPTRHGDARRTTIPTTALAPALLATVGAPVPEYMTAAPGLERLG